MAAFHEAILQSPDLAGLRAPQLEQQRQTALLRDQEQAKTEADRQKVIEKFAPSYGFDRRRELTSLLGSG